MITTILLCVGVAAIALFVGAMVGDEVSDSVAVSRGWIRRGDSIYTVTFHGSTSTIPPRTVDANLGTRVRSLIDAGIFDAQIERAIRRNNERRG